MQFSGLNVQCIILHACLIMVNMAVARCVFIRGFDIERCPPRLSVGYRRRDAAGQRRRPGWAPLGQDRKPNSGLFRQKSRRYYNHFGNISQFQAFLSPAPVHPAEIQKKNVGVGAKNST